MYVKIIFRLLAVSCFLGISPFLYFCQGILVRLLINPRQKLFTFALKTLSAKNVFHEKVGVNSNPSLMRSLITKSNACSRSLSSIA